MLSDSEKAVLGDIRYFIDLIGSFWKATIISVSPATCALSARSRVASRSYPRRQGECRRTLRRSTRPVRLVAPGTTPPRPAICDSRSPALHCRCGAAECVRSLIPGALSILKGAVPDRARGLGHMAPTYLRREPGIVAPTPQAPPPCYGWPRPISRPPQNGPPPRPPP